MTEWIDLLGAAVLSTLGFGVWIGLAVALVQGAAGKACPSLRHAVALGGSLLLAVGFVATLIGLANVRAATPVDAVGRLPAGPSLNLGPWLAGVWLACAAWWLTRLLADVLAVRRLLRGGSVVRDRRLVDAFGVASRRARASTRLLEADIDSPCVAGWMRPAVLVPRGLADALAPDHLVAILSHELIHVRRRDNLAVFAGALADVVVGFHPLVRWLDRVARRSREEACDDAAAGAMDPVVYARALERLAHARHFAGPRFAPAFSPTLARVHRILRPHAFRRTRVAWTSACAAALIGALAVTAPSAVARQGRALAAALPTVHIQARDLAGGFTMSLRGGSVVAAAIAGEPVPRDRLVQRGPSVRVLGADGTLALAVQVHPGGGGISWESRPAPR